MINTEVINAIETIVNLDVVNGDFPYEELETALINSDYYIRHKSNRDMFMFYYYIIMEGKFPEDLIDPGIPNEMRTYMAFVGLVRTFFDRKYFEERCNSVTEKADCRRVRKYIKTFSRKKLKEYLILLINGRQGGDLFISNANSTNMWKTFNEECRKLDNSIPSIDSPVYRYSKLILNNNFYFYDYLSTDQISDIICDSIDKNADIAEKLAKILNDSGYKSAERYLNNVVTRVA